MPRALLLLLLAGAGGAFRVAVLGGTHTFRADRPFAHPRTQRPLTNVTRAETWGNPYHHALVMTVDPASPNLFRFEPLIVRH